MQVRFASVLKDGTMPRKTNTNGRTYVFAGARRCSLQEVLVQQAIAESMSGNALAYFCKVVSCLIKVQRRVVESPFHVVL